MNKYLLLPVLLFAHCLWGQHLPENIKVNVSTTKVTYLGKSLEVRDIRSYTQASRKAKIKFKRDRLVPDNFKGRRGKSKAIIPSLEHLGPDPLRQLNVARAANEPLINKDGIGGIGSPHDPSGDVGLNFYVQAINVTQVGIFDKNGNLVKEFAMEDLWEPFGAISAGDPIVLFDERENRWFITEFTDPANLLIAVSETDDPMGSYFVYSFSTPEFPDYPKYAIWPDALVVTTNEGTPGELHQYFIDKNALIAGEQSVNMQRVEIPGNLQTEAGFYVSTPVDVDGQILPMDNRPIALKLDDASWGQTSQDEIDLIRFDIDFDDPDNTQVESISIPTTNFDGFPCSVEAEGFGCVPQRDGHGLDAIPEVIMNVPKFRSFGTHESIVLSFVTDVTNGENLSGIRWVELRKTEENDWSLYQEGTFSPDGMDRYMSSIAIDKLGNIGLAYNVSSLNDYVGIRYTGRFVNDPLGQMTIGEQIIVEGENAIESGERFGDYAHMSVDPVSETTFWYTSEYASGGFGRSKTRIVAFQLEKDTFDLGAVRIVAPQTSSSLTNAETLSFELRNVGLEAISNFSVGFMLDGNLIATENISITLQPDSSLVHDFSTTIDLSEKGTYILKAFVFDQEDQNALNDTVSTTIFHLLDIDAAIVDQTENLSSCDDNGALNILLSNKGFAKLESGSFVISSDGNIIETIAWAGDLAFGSSEVVDIPVSILSSGENEITVTFEEVNGGVDEDTSNNSVDITISLDKSLKEFTFNLLTDLFPEETTWQILNTEDSVLASGGPYPGAEETWIRESFCAPGNACYLFEIFDSEGDGLCCEFGEGNYHILNAEGDTLLASDGQFQFQESKIFCEETQSCDLSASFVVAFNETEENSDVSILAQGGTAPYMYSIDGGTTFQADSLFEDLSNGEYQVIVKDATDDCQFNDVLNISALTNVDDFGLGAHTFDIKPNPTEGYFKIEFGMEGLQLPSILFDVVDMQGKIIQTRRMSSYNGIYTAPVSLLAYPSGMYLVRVYNEDFSAMKKIIKQ